MVMNNRLTYSAVAKAYYLTIVLHGHSTNNYTPRPELYVLRPESPHVAQMHEGGANRSVLRAPKWHGLHEGGANRSYVDRSELQLF